MSDEKQGEEVKRGLFWAAVFLLALIAGLLISGCALDESGLDPGYGFQGGPPGPSFRGPSDGGVVQGASGGAPPASAGGAAGASAGGAGGSTGAGGALAGAGGAPPPSFQTQAAECDPVTGAASAGGGARCGGGKTCEFACPPAGATARPTCTGEGYDGRSCLGGPCGWTSWSTGARKYLGCAYGSACFVPAAGAYFNLPAGVGVTTTSEGVCRAYCAGSADCGGQACDHDALPCAPAGTGLCPQAAPRADCTRV